MRQHDLLTYNINIIDEYIDIKYYIIKIMNVLVNVEEVTSKLQ